MTNRRDFLSFAVILAVSLVSFAPDLSAGVKKKKITTKILEFPQISVDGLDYSGLQAELAFGDIQVPGPSLKKKEIPCAFKDNEGKTRLKTTKMFPIHYYRVNYKGSEAYLVLKDGSGKTVWTSKVGNREDSWENFGTKNCGHISKPTLDKNWAAGKAAFIDSLRKKERAHLTKKAKQLIDNAVFPKYTGERFKLYYIKGESGYGDVNGAADRAESAYDNLSEEGSTARNRDKLKEAVKMWEKALEEKDLANKKARINRKVSVGLLYNLGVAKMFLNDFPAAARHLKESKQLTKFEATSKGQGALDLYDRVRQRQPGYKANRSWAEDDGKISQLMEESKKRRGKVAVDLLGSGSLVQFRREHKDASWQKKAAAYETAKSESEDAIAEGAENPYASKVQHTAMQGFTLFLMPYFGGKVDSFPKAICGLTHVNDLRIAGHGIDSVPDCIGKMTALKKLNLSKNKLTTLPDSIANLKNLKKLTLKKNKFSKAEKARIKGLLPKKTKVKF